MSGDTWNCDWQDTPGRPEGLHCESTAERVAANGRPLGRAGDLAESRERFAEHPGVPAARTLRGGVAEWAVRGQAPTGFRFDRTCLCEEADWPRL